MKASSQPWSIPDLREIECDLERRLVADFFHVIYFIGREEPKLCIIPKEAIKPEFVIPKQGYRISEKFKKEAVLKQFLRAI